MDVKLYLFFCISVCHLLIICSNYNKDVNSIETFGKHKRTQQQNSAHKKVELCLYIYTGKLFVCMGFYLNLLHINNSHFYLFVHVKLKIPNINYDTLLIMNRGTEKEESCVCGSECVYTPLHLCFISPYSSCQTLTQLVCFASFWKDQP